MLLQHETLVRYFSNSQDYFISLTLLKWVETCLGEDIMGWFLFLSFFFTIVHYTVLLLCTLLYLPYNSAVLYLNDFVAVHCCDVTSLIYHTALLCCTVLQFMSLHWDRLSILWQRIASSIYSDGNRIVKTAGPPLCIVPVELIESERWKVCAL